MKQVIKNLLFKAGVEVRRLDNHGYAFARSSCTPEKRGDTGPILDFFSKIDPFYEDKVPDPLKIAGAWRQDLLERRTGQLAAIHAGDAEWLNHAYDNLFFNELITGLWNFHYWSAATEGVLCQDHIRDIQRFEAVNPGALKALLLPKSISNWGVKYPGTDLIVNYVDVWHAWQALGISNLYDFVKARDKREKPVIMEIGSGFGDLAFKLTKLLGPATLVLVDIPLNLTTAYAFLRRTVSADVRVTLISSEADAEAFVAPNDGIDIVLVPTCFYDAATRGIPCDILCNFGSFSEMDYDTIAYYLSRTPDSCRFIYETNSATQARNSSGHIEVSALTFPVKENFKITTRLPDPGMAHSGRYVTTVYENVVGPA